MEADDATHGDLANLKSFLMTKVGLVHDPLTSSQLFMSRTQHPGERILDYVADLKKLFAEAYATENSNSSILVQRFITGLLPPIRLQLLLQGKPDTLAQAIKDAINIACMPSTLLVKLTVAKKLMLSTYTGTIGAP